MKQEFIISGNAALQKEDSRLSVRIGERHAGFAVTSISTSALSYLAWFTGEQVSAQTLDELYASSPALSGDYQETIICFDYSQSLLVPQNLFRDDSGRSLLEAGYGVMEFDKVFHDRIPSWQVVNTYAVPAGIHQWVALNFPKASQVHQYSVSIRNMTAMEEQGRLLLDFRSDDFTILLFRSNELMLAQTFPYSSPSDVIYYLLKCTGQFELEADKTTIVISGLLDQQSILYREMYQYFLGIEFRPAEWSLPADHPYPAHFFTSLNDLARCES